MMYFKAFLLSAVATFGFAMIFQAPRHTILPACIASGISWVIYDICRDMYMNYMLSAFLAAVSVGTFGEFLSRRYHSPATLFILPGLIPLVPGAGMYYSMTHLIAQEYSKFIEIGAQTFFTAAALSIGVVVSSNFSRSLKRVKLRKKQNAQ